MKKRIAADKLFTPKNLLIIFILIKLAVTLIPINYGIGGDEVYYIAMSDRLDIGYVDVPPLVPLLLAAVRLIFGTNFFSLHILPAIAGALVTYITYLLVKRLGGKLWSYVIAFVCVTFAPQYMDFNYSYDTFDKLCWVLLLYIVVLILQTDEKKYWLYFGLAAGVGLLCKISIAFLLFALVIALIFVKQRKHFRSWQLWTGAGLALLIFSPYVVWQFIHGFTTAEYYRNYSGTITEFTPLSFLWNNIFTLNPISLPVWAAGFVFLLRDREKSGIRLFGIAYIILLVVGMGLNMKPYVITPFYVMLFAGGAVYLEKLFETRRRVILSYGVILLLISLAALPMTRPLLPPGTYIRIFGGAPPGGVEKLETGSLPQNFATRFGWEEMTAKVAKVYESLSEEDKSKACILAGNYSEAGAIHLYGGEYGLPEPISGHNQYHIWGAGDNTGEVTIAIGVPYETLRACFREIVPMEKTDCGYAMPHENNLTVYLCRGPARPLNEMDPWFKWLV